MTPDLTLVRAFPTLLALGLAPCCAPAAEIYPPTDPPLPTLIEPGQTEEPSVYRARRDALMKEIGEEQRAADLEFYGKVSAKLAGVSTRALPHTLARMRSRHSAGEIALIQRAVRISEEGFRAAVMEIRPGAFEGRVEAEAERVW